MSDSRDHPSDFRDLGILPTGLSEPASVVRCWMPWYQLIPQFTFTALMFGASIFAVFNLLLNAEYLWAIAVAAGFGWLLYAVCNDAWSWIELNEETIRARHFYFLYRVEVNLDEVTELQTVVHPRTVEGMILDRFLGRIRAVRIHVRSLRFPIAVYRADPAMKNAEELIRAVIYKMNQQFELKTDVVMLHGEPLVKRIYRVDVQP